MLSKILVPVDGSTQAEGALDYAIFLAKTCGASLGTIHVAQVPTNWSSPTIYSHSARLEDDRQTYLRMIEVIEANGNDILAKAEAKAKAAGLKVEKIKESGHPADLIVKVASDNGYDLIVMGSRGNSSIKEALLGSVSHHVCQYAKCSVLLAR
jgi:nucleotide-binding universal stress UspA family protein